MKKLVLFLLVSFSVCSSGFAQDFTFDQLSKMRSYSLPKFESIVHDKGYSLNHLVLSPIANTMTMVFLITTT
jgi:hypothetical protein